MAGNNVFIETFKKFRDRIVGAKTANELSDAKRDFEKSELGETLKSALHMVYDDVNSQMRESTINKTREEFSSSEGRMNMYFNDAEKNLIEKGLAGLREKLENNRSFFEMGSVQREHLENKIDAICDLRNNLYKSEFSQVEKNVIFEALDGMKETFIKSRGIFDVGTVPRENLEAKIDQIDNIKNNINNAKRLGSLDSFINAAKQQQSNQSFQNVPQRNNDLVI